MFELKIGEGDAAMGWMEFVASMTGALAWPLALVIVAIVFREHIVGLFRRVEEIGFGGATAKLAKELDKAEEIATTLPEPPGQALQPEPVAAQPQPQLEEVQQRPELMTASEWQRYHRVEEETFDNLLSISPSAAILVAWKPVDQALRALAMRNGLTERKAQRTLPATLADELARNGKLPITVVTMIAELQRIRGIAAHQKEVGVGDAMRFKRLADEALHNLMYKWDQ